MKNLTYYIFSILLLSSCTKDLGNYTYEKVNEITISNVDAQYNLLTDVDILKISPKITHTEEITDSSRFEYTWYIDNWTRKPNVDKSTISKTKSLNYSITLSPGEYRLMYRILDKKTGIQTAFDSQLIVNTPYSRGWLIIGEDEDGYADAEMLSIIKDTIHFKNLYSNQNMPRLKNPISFNFFGAKYDKAWFLTKEGSYFFDRNTMKINTANTINSFISTNETINPETTYPISLAFNGYNNNANTTTGNRAFVTNAGDLFVTNFGAMQGDFYLDAVNRLSTDYSKRIKCEPFLMHSLRINLNSIIWYDTEDNRFLMMNNFVTNIASSLLRDNTNDPFLWNSDTPRKLIYAENTKNNDGGSTNGNSYSITKHQDNSYHIYKFYVNGPSSAKRAAYQVKDIATNFNKADFYAFSSNRSVVFYSVANKLYAYDYTPGFERIYTFPEIGTDPITMIKFDLDAETTDNYFYIATYNNSENGKLRKYKIGIDPNTVDITLQPNSTWTNMLKIKDINWRYVL